MTSRASYSLPDVHPFVGCDAWTMLSTRADATPRAPFLTWRPLDGPTREWTYASFANDVCAVAAGLTHRGVAEGDKVIIHLENCPEFAIAWFALAALGAVAVTTNARSASDELRYFAEDCKAVGVITQPKFEGLMSEAVPQAKWAVYLDEDPNGDSRRSRDDDSWTALHHAPDQSTSPPPDPGRPVSVQYTSGTTSRPKGVLWTHANVLWAARVNAAHEQLTPADCHLITNPLFHANAFAYSLLPTIWTGGRAVLTSKWSTSRFWEISLEQGCTWASVMGLSLRAILAMEPPSRHSYRMFGVPAVDPQLEQLLGVRTVGWWGMTETVSHGIVSNPWQSTRPLSIGRAAPEYGIRVVGSDQVTPVEPEGTGFLLIRGVPGLSMFAEYLNQPEATADSYDASGWFRTGDLVTLHVDGCISFADRAKDLLRVGGENVAASEIERVIAQIPGVREAAVVSQADAKLDEVPVAFVIGDDEELEERVTNVCRSLLADFKVPHRVEVVRALPRSTVSKINKAALRAFLNGDEPLEAAEAQWLQQAANDPSGDADASVPDRDGTA